MLGFIEQIVNMMISFTSGIFIFLLTEKFLVFKFNQKIFQVFIIFVISYTINTAAIFPGELTGNLTVLIGFFLVILIFCKGPFLIKLSLVLLLFPIVASINYMTEDIGYLIWYHAFQMDMTEFGQTALHSFSFFLRIPFWFLIYRCTKNWIADVSKILTRRMWLVIDTISLVSFIAIISIIYKSSIDNSYHAYPVCIGVILTSLGCFYLCSYIARSLRRDMEIKMLRYQQTYYMDLEENQNTLRRIRHDMKNHLNIIGSLLQNDEIEQAKGYFHKLSEEFDVNTRTFCKNSILNAVFNAKYNLAIQNGIECIFQVDMDESCPVDDIMLCSLFANTLDNAVEAARQMKDPSLRKITLKARCHKGFLSYFVSNTKENQIVVKDGSFLTGKEDKDSHGLGINNVKGIVEKYDGHIDITYTETDFTVTVLI